MLSGRLSRKTDKTLQEPDSSILHMDLRLKIFRHEIKLKCKIKYNILPFVQLLYNICALIKCIHFI